MTTLLFFGVLVLGLVLFYGAMALSEHRERRTTERDDYLELLDKLKRLNIENADLKTELILLRSRRKDS
jgi:hypothetical protein